jgi:hypothetical protein
MRRHFDRASERAAVLIKLAAARDSGENLAAAVAAARRATAVGLGEAPVHEEGRALIEAFDEAIAFSQNKA